MDLNRADAIAEDIERLIFDGTFADGDRLDEVRLAERFGVSRTPVREALQRLAQSGLAEHRPRRGTFVRQPGPVELMDMFEVMAELEATCGRLAARRIGDAALARLDAANALCSAAARDGRPDDYFRDNEDFHRIIYAEAGNAFLAAETLRLSRRLRPFRRMQLRHRGRLSQSMTEHEAIVEALRAGHSEAAAEALRSHVGVQGEKFHLLMSSLREARLEP